MSVTLTSSLRGTENETERYWTTEEFYRAAEAGAFDDPDRLELIQGRLRRLMQGQRHANLRVRISRRLRSKLEPPLFVRDENPLHIAFDGEPIADLLLTYQEEYAGRHPHPKDVGLLIEVADSSAEYDLGEKALLYSGAGIEDCWVVLVRDNVVVQHRQPMASGYAEVTRLAGAEPISPLAAPEIVWAVDTLLGRAEAAEGERTGTRPIFDPLA